MRVAIAGSSGLIGTRLTEVLRSGDHEVVRLVRHEAAQDDERSYQPGEPLDAGPLEDVHAVINLAGPGIGDKRWNEDRKRLVKQARVDTTATLADAIAASDDGPSVFLSGSAIGFYGDRGDAVLDEGSDSGDGYLAEICRAWEAATRPANEAARVVRLRTGIVLDADDGALAKMLPLFKVGLGGRMGSGRQWWSWISLDDEVAAIAALLTADVEGPVNLVAPEPVRNADFSAALGDVLGRPSFLPVPSFGPKLLLGSELADELLFASQRVQPTALTETGFTFRHGTVGDGLRAAIGADQGEG